MVNRSITQFVVCSAIVLCSVNGAGGQDLSQYRTAAVKRWSKDIARFDELNQSDQTSADSILFIGSSSIRRWNAIADDMAPYKPIQRGYGGAKYSDMAVFAQRIITPHAYRAIVMFVGNGVVGKSSDLTPDEVESLTRHIVGIARAHQPQAPFLIIEITPTEKRFDAWPKIRAANARLREVALTTPMTYFVPTASHFLTPDGKPRSELFVDDRLHLNQDGYQLWSRLIKHRLDEIFAMTSKRTHSENLE